MWFNTIKRFYDMGHEAYTVESVKIFVVVEWITAEEYQIITGVEYVA